MCRKGDSLLAPCDMPRAGIPAGSELLNRQMDRMFKDADFQAYFSRFYSEFSGLYAEFQAKSTVYSDFWQFVMAKAAREMGILEPGSDRQLTPEEIGQLYSKIMQAMPSIPIPNPGEVPALEDETADAAPDLPDATPGSKPKPSWFNLELPEDKGKTPL